MSKDDAVLVRNACWTPLRYVSWERAISAVVSGDADITQADETREVRSAYLTLPWPLEITLRKYAYVPHVGRGGDPVSRITRTAVLAAHDFCCIYCGEKATTIDHVFPKSRGGKDTPMNLVAACFDCNQKKADRTPEEAGLRMLWPPRHFNKQESLERAVKRRSQRSA